MVSSSSQSNRNSRVALDATHHLKMEVSHTRLSSSSLSHLGQNTSAGHIERDPGTSPPPSSVRRLSTDVDECKKSLTDIRFLCGDDDYYYDHISTAILARSHKIQFTASFVTVKLAGNKGRQSLKYRLARYFFIFCVLCQNK